ncbi:MAG: hypothetical protein J5671_03395 [Bacteroidaceae bacterium]|nr:hypothetical protein [Bacteroidaceae bacterium]
MEKLLETAMGEDPLKVARGLVQGLDCLLFNYKDMEERLAEYERRIQELEQENEQLRNEQQKEDEWSSRVTYEGVVEQIAACEDAKERDEARKLIEPLLKKDTATRFRKDIRRRVKELSDGGSANITIGKVEGDFNVNKAVKQIGN